MIQMSQRFPPSHNGTSAHFSSRKFSAMKAWTWPVLGANLEPASEDRQRNGMTHHTYTYYIHYIYIYTISIYSYKYVYIYISIQTLRGSLNRNWQKPSQISATELGKDWPIGFNSFWSESLTEYDKQNIMPTTTSFVARGTLAAVATHLCQETSKACPLWLVVCNTSCGCLWLQLYLLCIYGYFPLRFGDPLRLASLGGYMRMHGSCSFAPT